MRLLLLFIVVLRLPTIAVADDTLSRSVLYGMQTRYAAMVARESETCSLLTMAVESSDPDNRIHGMTSSRHLPEQQNAMIELFRKLRVIEKDPAVSEEYRIIFYNLEQRERALNPPFHPLEAEIAGKLRARLLEVQIDQDAYAAYINPGLATDVDDSVIDLILSLKRVRFLHLTSKSISNEAFSRLSKLTTLELLSSPASVGDAGLAWVGDAPNLKGFDARNMTDETLRVLSKSKTLTIFSTSSPAITDEGLKFLASIHTLKSLTLPQQITATGVLHLSDLPLDGLTLRSTSNSDAMLEAVGKIGELKYLNLRLEGTTVQGFAALTQLKKLELLHAGGIDGREVYLKELPSLKSVAISKLDSSNLNHLMACPNLKFLWAATADLNDEQQSLLKNVPFQVHVAKQLKK